MIQHIHDLIHKACGWMLREVAKRVSEERQKAFLLENERLKLNTRTMLHYSIEMFSKEDRAKFMPKV